MRQRWLPVTLIILIGFLLRLFQLTAVPLRGDEAFSVQYWARLPLSQSLTEIATLEPHPVLTYGLFHGWGLLAGTSVLAMRLLPALIGLLGIPALYRIGSRLINREAGLLAALLFALHPFAIWHAQDARNNAIWAGLSLVTMWFGLQALDQPRRSRWVWYAILATITCNIFYFEWLPLLAFGVYVLLRQRAHFAAWVLAALPAFLTSGASFLILQGGLIFGGAYAGTTASRLDIGRLFTWFLPTLSIGDRLLLTWWNSLLWPLLLILFIGGVLLLWRYRRDSAILLLTWIIVPVGLLSAAASRLNIFDPRYVLPILPALILMLAGLIVLSYRHMRGSRLRWGLPLAVMGCWLGITGVSLANYYFNPATLKSRDWPALTKYLRDETQADDLVIQLSVDAAFGYYYDAPAPNLALPERPSQPAAAIESALASYSGEYRSIWVVGQTFPDWPNVGVVEGWLNQHMQRVRSGQAADLHYWQYMPWEVNPDEVSPTPLATFDQQVELMGYRWLLPANRDETLTVWLYWRPVRAAAVPLKVFVHLIGSPNPATGSPLWSQDDRFPQNGQLNTVEWTTGELYRDIYSLPLAQVPAGTYALAVGFYDPDTGERLPLGDGDAYRIPDVVIP